MTRLNGSGPFFTEKKPKKPYTVDLVKVLTATVDRADFTASIVELAEQNPKLINNEGFQTVLAWIVSYYNETGEPPAWNALIEWATEFQTTGKDLDGFPVGSDVADLISEMDRRAGKYLKTPLADLEATAEQIFKAEAFARLTLDLERSADKPETGEALLEGFKPPSFDKEPAFDVSENLERFVDLADTWGQGESLVDWKKDVKPSGDRMDALAEFFGNCLMPGAFVSFVGRAKVGKSYWLTDVTVRGLLSGCHVLYLQCGDMPEGQSNERILNRICQRPTLSMPFKVPRKILHVAGEWKTVQKFYNDPNAKKTMPKKIRLVTGQHFFQEKCPPDSWLKTKQFSKGQLTSKELDRLVKRYQPSLVVLDFVDLLYEVPGIDKRHAVERNWGELRAIAIRHNVPVVTATQSDAKGYTIKWLGLENFSDSKDKNGHCSDMIGINQSSEEKRYGVYRLNWVARRNADSTVKLVTAACLPKSDPAVLSEIWTP